MPSGKVDSCFSGSYLYPARKYPSNKLLGDRCEVKVGEGLAEFTLIRLEVQGQLIVHINRQIKAFFHRGREIY
jgi:hypothetical protein